VGRLDAFTSAEPRELRSHADGKVPRRLDAEEASLRRPRARAGCRGCGTDGNSNDRLPRSPRTSDADDQPRRHAGDSFRTIEPPTDSWARTQASSAPAPSSRARELCRSRHQARFFLALLTRWLGAREDRSVPSQLPMGNGNGLPGIVSPIASNQQACGESGGLARATRAPRPIARFSPPINRGASLA
jgi:hypothetical protein